MTAQTQGYQSMTTPGKSENSIPTVYATNVENVPEQGTPYQPNPIGISHQQCNCSSPTAECTHHHQSTINNLIELPHQSPSLIPHPQQFQLPPPNLTPHSQQFQ